MVIMRPGFLRPAGYFVLLGLCFFRRLELLTASANRLVLMPFAGVVLPARHNELWGCPADATAGILADGQTL
jgi:hypothetical protein